MGIFEQIKNAFSKGDEEHDERKVMDRPSPAVTPEPDQPPALKAAETYTVQSGDTLWRIADRVYGDGDKYTILFEANSELLGSPDGVLPGQALRIPAKH